MGIDVYAEWKGITGEEKNKQYTGFAIDQGCVGYLREAYHGSPYATKILFPRGSGKYKYSTLKKRLPKTIEVALERQRKVYNNDRVQKDDPVIKSFVDFVKLVGQKEKETGRLVNIIVSG